MLNVNTLIPWCHIYGIWSDDDLFPLLTVIYSLSVNHGILYCSCRHKRSSLDLKQFRVSLVIIFSGREFQSSTIRWLKKEPRTSSLKRFLWIFWLWPSGCGPWSQYVSVDGRRAWARFCPYRSWSYRHGSYRRVVSYASVMAVWAWRGVPHKGGIGDWELTLLRVVGSSQPLFCRFGIVDPRWYYHTPGVVWPWQRTVFAL